AGVAPHFVVAAVEAEALTQRVQPLLADQQRVRGAVGDADELHRGHVGPQHHAGEGVLPAGRVVRRGAIAERGAGVAVVVAAGGAAVDGGGAAGRAVVDLDRRGVELGAAGGAEEVLLLDEGQYPVAPAEAVAVVHLAGGVLLLPVVVGPVAAALVGLR